ncbi:hypothetical protein PHLCEN_2v976 [Hermanssonia centrifuga]|uniref:Uncharacterized protein n=1 Tax=Hermanssonia centrifuga TaxID=98765 RepID=A0A2R6S4C3_9APHY|nr:hypothetical protein PHLCEN_2v976 [Hermanssonia centrifuga]
MTPRPLPVYYSFDLVEGYAYQPSVEPVLWHPFNPLYDPGPPPPPRDPKKQKEQKGKSKDVDGAGPAAGAARSPPRATVHLPPPGLSHPYNAYARLGVPVAGPSARGGRFARGRGYPPSQQQRNVESNASAATNGFVPRPPENPASPRQHSRGSHGMNRRGGRGGGGRGFRGGGPWPVSP